MRVMRTVRQQQTPPGGSRQNRPYGKCHASTLDSIQSGLLDDSNA